MMVEMAPLITGAAGLLGGLLVRRRRPVPADNPAPICPCGGSVSFHEEGTGRCHHQVERASKWSQYGLEVAYEWVPCTCQHYAGPELISAYSVRPMTLRASTNAEPSLEAAAAVAEKPKEQENRK